MKIDHMTMVAYQLNALNVYSFGKCGYPHNILSAYKYEETLVEKIL